ncbi:alternative ribosome rescue aminoacyl-tRNA hydrolase ArfB [Corynebacterium sp.]|uniref:alternative ribosome rescue aminoacyl-tRNA hydrolase ArfB n=1 Tax=Corynebacterium sp. TaxID=1720 RepID=UPI0026E03492|nr:alternative ribosome rescue aminoacyl-tRNA hydrolase ArfB [Corynebacterium sp.]MDO5513251.1 alternative ribosome rescue aminoacyl-tRNA hydrolase ArfB [Corynebacterium sp.]
MEPLRLDPGPGIPGGLSIPAADLHEQFSRSSGPGGQGVNTTDSRVQLSIDLATTTALDEHQRRRALRNLDHRLAGTVLQVESSTQRSQLRNRAEARRRLAALLREALAPPPPPRRRTKPTRGSVRRRLAAKRHRSDIKSARRRPDRSGE